MAELDKIGSRAVRTTAWVVDDSEYLFRLEVL